MTLPSDANNTSNAPPMPPSERALTPVHAVFPHPLAVAHQPPSALSAAPNATALLKALRRRLGIALTLGLLLAAVAGTVAWFVIPPAKLTARTQLHVDLIPPSVLFGSNQVNANDFFMRNQAYLIKDRFVLNAALRDPQVAELSLIKEQPDPVQWLEREIKVEFPSPEFMHITLSGDRPAELLKIVSAVTKAYLDGVVNKDRIERQQKLTNLKRLLAQFEEQSQKKRETLKRMQKQNGALSVENMAILQQIALETLQNQKRELSRVQQELVHLRVEMGLNPDWLDRDWPQYTAVLNGLPLPGLLVNHAAVALLHDDSLFLTVDMRELDEVIDQDNSIVEHLRKIHLLKARIEKIREAAQPAMFEKLSRKERSQLADVEKMVAEQREKLRPIYREKVMKQLYRDARNKQTNFREKYRHEKVYESALIESVTRLDGETKQIRDNAVDLGSLLKDCDKEEKLIDMTSEQIRQLEVEQEAPSRVTQPDKEAVLYTPDATKRKVMMTAGVSVAVLAVVLLAFAWFDFQARKVHSPDEVVQGLGLNIVGTVPDHSPRSWLPWSRHQGDAVYTQSLLTESVDAARTMLLHVAQQEKLQVVMITSALAGEGKTSLASHLAASLARAGRHTLLLDSDMRNPTLHRLFDLSRTPGLSELLRGEIDLDGVIRATAIDNLSIISAGQADAVALQSLALDAIPQLFEKLRLRYDFIVVDSCPVLPVADSMLVGQHVDAVIFSLLRDVSRMPRIHAAYQRLALLGIRMLGAVVNGTQHDRYPADYHHIAQD
jgi:succinoglycan biosynthesis transport protein ExoP